MDFILTDLRQFAKNLNHKTDGRTYVKVMTLIELVKQRGAGFSAFKETDFKRAGRIYQVSARSVRRWWSVLNQKGVMGLKEADRSGRPKQRIRGGTAKLIRRYRKLYNWGADVIHAHLVRDHGIDLGVYRIHEYLRRCGFLNQRIRRQKKSIHTKVVKITLPGAHTQTDVKHLPHFLRNRKKCYVYNFVDHASKWTYKRAYDSYGPSETRDFFERLLRRVPFKIFRSQHDNGVEFTNRYRTHEDDPRPHALETLCKKEGIRHVLIPPGEKELQGLVERSHRQDDEELYHRLKPNDLESFNRSLEKHVQWLNQNRRRASLHWNAANAYLELFNLKMQILPLAKLKDSMENELKAGLNLKQAA